MRELLHPFHLIDAPKPYLGPHGADQTLDPEGRRKQIQCPDHAFARPAAVQDQRYMNPDPGQSQNSFIASGERPIDITHQQPSYNPLIFHVSLGRVISRRTGVHPVAGTGTPVQEGQAYPDESRRPEKAARRAARGSSQPGSASRERPYLTMLFQAAINTSNH